MRKLLLSLVIVLLASSNALLCSAQHQVGDTVTISGSKFKLTGNNLIPNPGFEEGFSGWTDASTSAAELSSASFKLVASGGVDDSQYLVGTTNSSSSAAGSIGTGWAIEAGKTYYFSYYVKYEDNTASAGTEQYTKISLTNNKTSSEEPYVLLSEATVNSGGQWTRNQVAFTNTTPYSYIVARFRWLNNRQGFDNFSLHEAYEIPSTTALEAAISEAQSVYDPQASGAGELLAAITAAQGFLSSESAEEIKQATTTLEEAVAAYKLLNASATNPVDMTRFIVNQGFDNNDASGWNGGGTVGYHSIEYYEKTFDLHQVISGLPAGKYTLKAQGFERPKHNDSGTAYQNGTETIYARVYAKAGSFAEKTTPFSSIYRHPYSGTGSSNGYVNTMQSAEIMFTDGNNHFEITLENVLLGEGDALTIGAKSDFTQSGYWALMDNFRLMYEGLDAALDAAKEELQAAIDSAITVYGDGSGKEAAALSEAIVAAQAIAARQDAGLDELMNTTTELYAAVFAFGLANSTGTPPTVMTNPNFARGATMAFGRLTVSGVANNEILEQGFCWSTSPEPTILDNRTTNYFSNNGYIYYIENLEPATIYYMRAYALTKDYAVGYGDVLKVITIPKGTVTYGLDGGVTGEHRTRIDAAMRDAVNYFNNLTSIQGHYLTVNYGSGTPTAEASYGGWMRFGPSASYQQTGTALHEMGHTVGVGTHSYWYNTSGSPLRGNGTWLGDRTSNVVQFLDNNTTGVLYGDGTHMWPYGINGAHEDTGSTILYIGNALIHQALGEDGLPPTNGFATPAYTFEYQDNAKYYIKNEADTRGRDTAFLVENENGNLVYRAMTPSEALANDNAAWYFEFNPANAYYRIRNAASGKYFTYKGTGTNGITLVEKEAPATGENFQLMRARIDTQIGEGDNTFTTRGYWIVRPEKQLNPQCFVGNANGATAAAAFSITNTATTQRWLLLSAEEVRLVEEALPTTDLKEINTSGVEVYGGDNLIEVTNISVPSDIAIHDVSGKLQATAQHISGSYSQSLSKGIYLVSISSVQYKDVKKVIVR